MKDDIIKAIETLNDGRAEQIHLWGAIITTKEFAEAMNISNGMAKKRLEKMVDTGIATKYQDNSRGRQWRYSSMIANSVSVY